MMAEQQPSPSVRCPIIHRPNSPIDFENPFFFLRPRPAEFGDIIPNKSLRLYLAKHVCRGGTPDEEVKIIGESASGSSPLHAISGKLVISGGMWSNGSRVTAWDNCIGYPLSAVVRSENFHVGVA